jgi:ureidoglycolate lyase
MRIGTFKVNSGPEIGVIDGDEIISISRAAPQLAPDMIGLMNNWPDAKRELERLVSKPGQRFALENVRLLAPVARPPKMLAIGLNYGDHVGESGLAVPDTQTWFCKQASSVNGPYDMVQIPRASDTLDYEVELVVIVGKGGRHISRKDAPDHVFGYCVGNDFSVRDWQLATSQWMLGKSFDTHAPFGPWITTSDEVDPHNLGIRCIVNEELRQNSNTSHFVYNIWEQIEHLSTAMTLGAGDVIFTGTPGGVGLAFKPPKFLVGGDRVRCEIDGLGYIENICQPEA